MVWCLTSALRFDVWQRRCTWRLRAIWKFGTRGAITYYMYDAWCVEQLNVLYIFQACGNSRITEYQRLTTFRLDPLEKLSDRYTEANWRLTAYELRVLLMTQVVWDRFPRDKPYWRYLMPRVLRGVPPSHSQPQLKIDSNYTLLYSCPRFSRT